MRSQNELINKLKFCSFFTEDFASEYKARYNLAQYFKSDEDDQWLVDHFFNTCLHVAFKIKTDGGKMKAEGHCNTGLCCQSNGMFKF